MTPYANRGRKSSIVAYESTPDSLTVQFADGSAYLYTARSVGQVPLLEMQLMAEAGAGLNAYIGRYARKKYEQKLA